MIRPKYYAGNVRGDSRIPEIASPSRQPLEMQLLILCFQGLQTYIYQAVHVYDYIGGGVSRCRISKGIANEETFPANPG
jgi:hypothetical protein